MTYAVEYNGCVKIYEEVDGMPHLVADIAKIQWFDLVEDDEIDGYPWPFTKKGRVSRNYLKAIPA